MKRLVTIFFVASFLLLSLSSSLLAAAPPPTASTATATPASASPTPARGAPPVVSTTAIVPAGTRGAPPTAPSAPATASATTPAAATTTATAVPATSAAPACAGAATTNSVALAPATAGADQQEVTALRTRTSRTFAPKKNAKATAPKGSVGYTAIVAPGSINYQDAKGAWQPIDNTLVASGATIANKANRYALSLPATLGGAPVHVALGGAWVEFSLANATGAGATCGDTETYAGALPGVALAFTAGNDTAKETLTLASAAAPHTFVYHLATSAGLTAKEQEGGIAFVDGKGVMSLAFTAPTMDDHTGAHSAAVTLKLGQDAQGATVTLDADAAWLAAPARQFPVVIDPTVGFQGSGGTSGTSSNVDCPIDAATPTMNLCGGTTDTAGWDGTNAKRTLLQFNNLDTVMPAVAQILSATIALHVVSATGTTAASLGVYPLTRTWTSGATWNTYDGTHNWTAAGGDFGGTALTSNANPADSAGWRWFPVTSSVQGWLNGTTTNDGVVLKEPTENANDVLTFSSTRATDAGLWPYLTVHFDWPQGERRSFPLVGQTLSDRMDAQVNALSGNLVIHARDLHIAGTGLDLNIDRYFNNNSDYEADAGVAWTFNQGYDIQLWQEAADLTMVMQGPTGALYPFRLQSGGGYTTPAGMDATLVHNGDGTYTVTYHQSGAQYKFSSAMSLSSITDKNGNAITYSYGTGGALATITDTQGRVVTVTTTSGLTTQITDSASRNVQYGYDTGADEMTSYTDARGKVTYYAYDANRNLTQITDPNGQVTKFTYDTRSRVTTMVRVNNPGAGTGPTTTFTYNVGNTVVGDANGKNTTYTYSALGLVTSVQDGNGHTQAATYNADDNVLTQTDAISPTGNVTTMTYGANNGESLTQMQLPASASGQTSASASWTYTDVNHPYTPHSGTDAQGNQFTYAYDTPGNLTTLTNQLASGNQVSATYNSNGTVATTTDANSHQTTYTYTYATSSPHILTKLVIAPPSPQGSRTINYDTLGRVASVVDGKGQATTYTRSNLDRLTRTTFNNDTSCSSRTTCTDYTYDDDGNLTSVIDGTGTTTFTYGPLNHQVTKTLPGAGSASDTYTYDGVGNLLTLADAGGTVTYGYDAANNLTALAEPGGSCTGTVSKCTTFAYDNNNRRTTTTYPNGVALTQAYDKAGHLASIVGAHGGTTLTSFTYSYASGTTDRGLRQTRTKDGTITATYSYDAANRLTGAVGTGFNFQYTYDGAGNRQTATYNGSSVFGTPTYNGANELTAMGTVTLGYDGDGNETGRSVVLTALAYNAKNQTTSMTGSGTVAGMTYTGDSQVERISAGSDSFGYNVLGMGSKTTGGSTIYYTRDNAGRLISERIGSTCYYYLFDGLDSVVALTDGTGSAVDTYTYNPYGQVTPGGSNSVANAWEFGSGYYDAATGLVKLGQRFYDASLGRWTQQDPVPQGNLYTYTGDDPVNFTDPTGTSFLGALSGALYVAAAAAEGCAVGCGLPPAASDALQGTAIALGGAGGAVSYVDNGGPIPSLPPDPIIPVPSF